MHNSRWFVGVCFIMQEKCLNKGTIKQAAKQIKSCQIKNNKKSYGKLHRACDKHYRLEKKNSENWL